MSRVARRAAKRDLNERAIVAALRGIPGVTVYPIDEPVDLLVGVRGAGRRAGVNLLVEIKRPAGPRGGTSGRELTDSQREFFASWPGPAYVVRDVVDAVECLDAHRELPTGWHECDHCGDRQPAAPKRCYRCGAPDGAHGEG